jgi:hypothetical protein
MVNLVCAPDPMRSLILETFVFAELRGIVPVNEKAQCLMADKIMLDIETPNPSDEWKECQKQLGKSDW